MRREIEEAIAITPRDRIYSTIVQNPGLHFREIQRRVDIATGALQYHLDYLKKKNFIREEKEGKFSRFYSIGQNPFDEKLMNLLRQKQVRQIVLSLIDKKYLSFDNIISVSALTSSAVSFHLKKLVESNIVSEKKVRGKTVYFLTDKMPIMEILINYKSSFLDSIVDNFVSIWENELGL